MPNSAQQELLDSFIADEGIYFQTIIDDEAFNLGTKILYLKRAISQDCQTFNQALDKLYNPDLVDGPKKANIEFIRALKLINDLCFNNEVKYGQYGTRLALTHYFGSLGAVDASGLQTAVEEIINARITALSDSHEETITEQKQARQTAETGIHRQTGWRTELDLPSAQLAPQIPHFQPGFFQLAQPPQERWRKSSDHWQPYDSGSEVNRHRDYRNENPTHIKAISLYGYTDETYSISLTAGHDAGMGWAMPTIEHNQQLIQALQAHGLNADTAHVGRYPNTNSQFSNVFIMRAHANDISQVIDQILATVESLEGENACQTIRDEIVTSFQPQGPQLTV